MFDYVRHYSCNARHICCEDSATNGLYDHWQSDDLDLYSRSHVLSQPELLVNLQYLGQHLSYYIQTWHDGRP